MGKIEKQWRVLPKISDFSDTRKKENESHNAFRFVCLETCTQSFCAHWTTPRPAGWNKFSNIKSWCTAFAFYISSTFFPLFLPFSVSLFYFPLFKRNFQHRAKFCLFNSNILRCLFKHIAKIKSNKINKNKLNTYIRRESLPRNGCDTIYLSWCM